MTASIHPSAKRILLVAATTGYQTGAFGGAASHAGFELVLATDRCHVLEDPWGDRAIPIRFEDPEGAAAAIVSVGERFDGIAAVGDRPAYIAALAAENLGLPFHPSGAVAACGDKFLTRERFRDAGLLAPAFFRVSLDQAASQAATRATFPCVLKPLGLSASRGVIRANNQAEFAVAFERIRALLEQPSVASTLGPNGRFVQIEDFIPGREFAIEGIVTGGKFHALALFDKPDPLDGPFFEETIYVTPSREPAEVQRAIVETTARAISALGLTHGPIHAEMRVNSEGVWMLEVAARPIGGLCAKVLPGLEELILRHAVGLDAGSITMAAESGGVMMLPIPRAGIYRSVRGVEQAARVPGVSEVIITAKPGQALVPLPEGNSYLGFVFAGGPAPEFVEKALRAAHSKLEFEVAATLPVL